MARHVVVAGAGPAGATAAYLLARRGVDVNLIERQTDFECEFRGEVLMPSGIDALRQAGLGEKLFALPHLTIDAVELYRGPEGRLRVPLTHVDRPVVVPQPPLLEMIVREAGRFSNFKFERGTTVRDLLFEGARVAGLRADTPSGPRDFRADFTIACDGRISVVRERLGFSPARISQAFDVVWAKVPANGPVVDHVARAYLGPGHVCLTYPSPLGHLQVGWVIKKGTFGDLHKLGAGEWIAEMTPHVTRELAEFLNARRDALSHPMLLDVACDRLGKWTAPGVLLIGDASHPMSPVGGQGINVALRDAIVTANYLGPALMHDDATSADLEAAAHRVQVERLPEIAQIQALQQIGPRTVFSGSWIGRLILSTPFIALARTVFAPALARRFEPFLYGSVPIRLRN